MKQFNNLSINEKIDYIFERLLLPIVISLDYKPYKDYYEDFSNMFDLVRNWISVYYNTNNLTKINNLQEFETFEGILSKIMPSCLEKDTVYIEEISIWFTELLSIYNSLINEKVE